MATLPQPLKHGQVYRGLVGLAAVLLVVPFVATGRFAYLVPLMELCGIYTILVTGLTLLMGFTGQVSLGHAGFYGAGAYAAAVAAQAWHWPLAGALVLALLMGGLLSFATGFMVLRLRGHLLALATLCLGVIIHELILKARITGGAAGLYDLPALDFGGLLTRFRCGKLLFIWSVVMLVLAWALTLTSSPVGRALRAIHGDEEAAAALGVRVFWLKLKVFVVSGVLAALAGVLYAFVYTPSCLDPDEFGLMFSVLLVTMVAIGGLGSVWGALAGAVTVTGLHEVITLAGESVGTTQMAKFEQLLFGLILVCIMIFSPGGMMPGLKALSRRLWRRRTVHD